MIIFDANISENAYTFFNDFLKSDYTFESINQELLNNFGLNAFFENELEFNEFKDLLVNSKQDFIKDIDRKEFGDFQTNLDLANKVALHLANCDISPEIIIEPTSGQGNFILASLSNFKTVKKIFAIEIFKPYVWQSKFNIIDYYLSNPNSHKPEITIFHNNIFDFNINKISKEFSNSNLLIIGNPPWVTNSKLGSISSTNLPKKSNFKNQNGFDAITGKGNFDIAEYITLKLLDIFQNNNGNLALLVKNSLIKNLISYQREKKFKIDKIEKYSIDSKKEFGVSVDASLLFCQLNSDPNYICNEFDLYSLEKKNIFGWVNAKFVSNIDKYNQSFDIDGECPFEWRQGIKHDCSNIMELKRVNGHYINNQLEEIKLEEDLVYGFLKSSDLKNNLIQSTRVHTIVTQSKVGQETSYIQQLYPKTYSYLNKNLSYFEKRKSSIYNSKPLFSIFGIGDYSFKPFKVAISGLYKTFHFTLVLPQNNKPIMLDDTCYFIGFDKIEYAVYSMILLNSKIVENFLKSITFADAKRVFTKEVLMRLDLIKIATKISLQDIEKEISNMNIKYDLNINLANWESYLNEMKPNNENQQTIF